MNNIAFVFPGQGAQYVGMGLEVAKEYKSANDVFERANNSLGFDIRKMCFEGPEEDLVKTENTQPAVLTASIAILKAVEELGLKADTTAGLSLGEYSALVYANAMKLEDAVSLVKKRGKYMQEAVPMGKGTMAAIIGLDKENVINAIDKGRHYGVVEAANFNCPGQIVISGEVDAVKKTCEICKEIGAKKAIELKVSAPFHSSLLIPAGNKLRSELDKITINELNKKVASNVTGKYIDNKDEIKDLLVAQVSKSVMWQDNVELMLNNGVDTIIEIGPGKSLTFFNKKISRNFNKKIKCYNVENIKSLNKLAKKLA